MEDTWSRRNGRIRPLRSHRAGLRWTPRQDPAWSSASTAPRGALLAVVGFLLGPIIRLALSRRRELLADASSVELTRNPAGLIRALQTLQRNDRPLARANHVTAALCIDDPLQHHQGRIHRLFDTHPPIEDRIAAPQRMAAGLSV